MVLGLLSASVPLDSQSCALLDHAAQSCGILPNTNAAHFTIVEGICIPRAKCQSANSEWIECISNELLLIGDALRNNPTITIESLHYVPSLGDKRTVLVVANVPSAFDAELTINILEHCALPQFPLHIVVGTCSTDAVEGALASASEKLVGLTLSLNVSLLAVLAPPWDETRIVDCCHCPNSNAREETNGRDILQESMTSAVWVANEVNRVLYERSVSPS